MRKSALCSLLFLSVLPCELFSNADSGAVQEIHDLNPGSPEIKSLREDIAQNLKETVRSGKLAKPLYFIKYRLKKNEHFFLIMAKMSQNMDTISSLNRLPHPGAVGPGDVLLIPSARGIFIEGDSKISIIKTYKTTEDKLIKISENRWFLPGGNLSAGEAMVFRGDGFIQPLSNLRITSRYGRRLDPFSRRSTFHGGIDIGASSGTSVNASREGTVIRAGAAGGYGNLIVISHQYGYTTYYGHLSKILVKNGQRVAAGQIIGLVGSTGKANGPHLHFEVRKNGIQKNPKFLHDNGSLASIVKQN